MLLGRAPVATPPPGVAKRVRRRSWLLVAVGVLMAAGAVPVVAFVIVPLFAQKQVNEALPVATTAPSAAAVSVAPTTPASPGVRTLAQGQLQRLDPVHFGAGSVVIVDLDGTRYLRFEEVTIAAAPDMYVYLSDRTDGRPGSFIDLGRVKGTSGSFNYMLPASLDLATVKSVVVWCRPFSVTVTYAPLQPR